MSHDRSSNGNSGTSSESPTRAGATCDSTVLQYIVDNVPAWIFWKDRHGVYRGCNQVFADLAGFANADAVIGKTDYEMPWAQHAEAYRAGDREVMDLGEPVLNREERIPDGSGGEMVILTSKVPMRDAAGEVDGIIGILANITERKATEVDLARAKEAAEQAAQARASFIAKISHELRTPLTLIMGPVVEALADPMLDATTRRLLERVERNSHRLYNLVNDVLDFSKADADRMQPRLEYFDLVELVTTLVDDAEPLARGRGLSLQLSTDVDRLEVLLDPRLCERSVLNLLSNAMKFTPNGGAIDVTIAASDDGVRVEVTDNGIGIGEEALTRLFEPFTQEDSSATRRYDGTGLGLTLVKHFVEAMGGTVDVRSQSDEGSTFTLTLPQNAGRASQSPGRSHAYSSSLPAGSVWRRRVDLDEHETTALDGEDEPQSDIPEAQGSSGDRPRILVADDNPDMRAYVMESLQKEFSVVVVENGARAWELAQKQPFDAVVSDVMMPELDGLALTVKIKQHPLLKDLPVILLTARGGSESATEGLDAGADDYVTKPFIAAELSARVRAAVRTTQLHHVLRDKAREAGMSQIATGVLHNIGNTLNSVNVSTSLLRRRVQRWPVDLLEKLSILLTEQGSEPARLVEFVSSDPRGQRLPEAVSALTSKLVQERLSFYEELDSLDDHVALMSAAVTSQQSLARVSTTEMLVELPVLVEQVVAGVRKAHGDEIHIDMDHGEMFSLVVDRPRLVQILVNLLSNAVQALATSGVEQKRIWVQSRRIGESVTISVSDNGIGISPEHIRRVFEHGFTSRAEGNGFGLHISAITAQEMGGTLTAHSDGLGMGASFSVTLPLNLDDRDGEALERERGAA